MFKWRSKIWIILSVEKTTTKLIDMYKLSFKLSLTYATIILPNFRNIPSHRYFSRSIT